MSEDCKGCGASIGDAWVCGQCGREYPDRWHPVVESATFESQEIDLRPGKIRVHHEESADIKLEVSGLISKEKIDAWIMTFGSDSDFVRTHIRGEFPNERSVDYRDVAAIAQPNPAARNESPEAAGRKAVFMFLGSFAVYMILFALFLYWAQLP